MEEIIELIKKTILGIAKKYSVEIDKIILFGSRARGIVERILIGIY